MLIRMMLFDGGVRRASKDGRADASNFVGLSVRPDGKILLLMLQRIWQKLLKYTLG